MAVKTTYVTAEGAQVCELSLDWADRSSSKYYIEEAFPFFVLHSVLCLGFTSTILRAGLLQDTEVRVIYDPEQCNCLLDEQG